MPTISKQASKKEKNAGKSNSLPDNSKLVKSYLLIALSGAILGLSAPGIDQWYLTWFGVAPLVISIATSAGVRQAFLRGLTFGLAYNLVYANFLLGLQPLNWLGFNEWQGWLVAAAAWFSACLHQGLITAIFAALARLMPMSGGFLPKKSGNGFALPALLTVPLLWVLIHHKIGNAHDALGIPWTMLEYSQYRQINIIQTASAIGGIGICFLIVMWNTALASLIASVWKIKNKMLAVTSREHAYYQQLLAAVILVAFLGLGFYMRSLSHVPATDTASIVQGNVNIDMQKTERRYTLAELMHHYAALTRQAPAGLCVYNENSLPTYLRYEGEVQQSLSTLAKQQHVNIIVGSLDHDTVGHPFNSAYGVSENGSFLSDVYHKRYLVPLGEYTPWMVEYLPKWVKKITNTPAGTGFRAGDKPVLLKFNQYPVAALICFETLSPELTAASVRAGGQVLVNVSDLAWFHESIIGRQMIAFSVLRAVENRRYFIFAANTGPSAIIDPNGYIRQISPLNKDDVLTGKFGLNAQLTPFTRWYLF